MASYVPKSMADLQKYVIDKQMAMVKETMTKKFYDIFEKTYHKYMEQWYGEYFVRSNYERSYEFLTDLPVEIKPINNGKTITCGISFDGDLSHDIWQYYNPRFGTYEDRVRHGETETLTNDLIYDSLTTGKHGFRDSDADNPTKPYTATYEELQSNMDLFLNELKSELSRNGFIVK